MSFYVYPYSKKEAEQNNELGQWLGSHKLNIECKNAIEKALLLSLNTDDSIENMVKAVRDQFGYDRLNWVFANTVQHQIGSDNVSIDNKEWSKKFFFDRSKTDDHTLDFVIDMPTAILDGFVNQARQDYDALNLFDHTHCLPDKHEQDLTGKVVVISPEMLDEEYKSPDFQLFVSTDGNGCKPNAIGRSVSGHFLKDGESGNFWRQDIIGILDEQYLPEWAKEQLAEQQQPDEAPYESEDAGMTMQ